MNAQTGEVKGFVYDAITGEVVESINIRVNPGGAVYSTNSEGYYSINDLAPGNYVLDYYLAGYDSTSIKIKIEGNKVIKRNIFIKSIAIELTGANISGTYIKGKKEDTDPVITITNRQLTKIPTVGGSPDLVQYLQILPGVVTSGDQGGQLYIRGGSPVMNKVLLDGMTIYNPFHSIGLFSVFDADIIKTADVYSAGFGAEYGGRVSAIIDVKTRDGNRNRLAGTVSVNPIVSKIMLEGPLKKFKPGNGSSSFVLSIKNSYLEKSSKIFYNYADPSRLPYNFSDIYAKMSFNSPGGSSFKVFGFNFTDNVNFPASTSYKWNSTGFGTRFTMVPEGTRTKIDGFLSYSGYNIAQKEVDNKPRSSGINGFNLGLHFSYFNNRDEFRYGVETNGFRTNFNIYNSNNRKIEQFENTTELAGFTSYKLVRGRSIVDLGLRLQVYASLGNQSLEPRLSYRYNVSRKLSLKAAAGRYSQNLLSAFSDKDVVNLFYGFLSGPDNLPKTFDGNPVTSRLQKAYHGVAGLEYNFNKNSELGIEGFYKNFTQITNINRDKLFDDDQINQSKPERLRKDFIVETGKAYGGDIRYHYETKRLYMWATYSLTYVTRYDSINTYNPNWDRRHNINIVIDYALDKKER
ncbi:MAG: TonB-dependent receptor, partial [Bacteroidia bacterium]|nr:TonB-dependent receptor [Bacteroidia bacterium]